MLLSNRRRILPRINLFQINIFQWVWERNIGRKWVKITWILTWTGLQPVLFRLSPNAIQFFAN